MYKFYGLLFFNFFVMGATNVSAAEYQKYQLRKGDKLSKLLYEKGFRPLYGKRGFVLKAVELNSNKIKGNGDFIKAGEFILLPLPNTATETPLTIGPVAKAPEPIEANDIQITNNHIDQNFKFIISPTLSWYKFVSDSKRVNSDYDISALSKASLGVDLMLKNNLADKYNYFFIARINSIKFYSDTAYFFTKTSHIVKRLGGGIQREFGSDNSLSLEVGMDDEVFLELLESNTIRPKIMTVPIISLSYSDEVLKLGQIGMGYGLISKAIFPHDTSISETGMGYGVGGEVFAKRLNLGFNIHYSYDKARALGQTTTTYDVGWSGFFQF